MKFLDQMYKGLGEYVVSEAATEHGRIASPNPIKTKCSVIRPVSRVLADDKCLDRGTVYVDISPGPGYPGLLSLPMTANPNSTVALKQKELSIGTYLGFEYLSLAPGDPIHTVPGINSTDCRIMQIVGIRVNAGGFPVCLTVTLTNQWIIALTYFNMAQFQSAAKIFVGAENNVFQVTQGAPIIPESTIDIFYQFTL